MKKLNFVFGICGFLAIFSVKISLSSLNRFAFTSTGTGYVLVKGLREWELS